MEKISNWFSILLSAVSLATVIVTVTLGYGALDKRIDLQGEYIREYAEDTRELNRIKANQKEVVMTLLLMKSELENKDIVTFTSSVDKAIDILNTANKK